MIRSGVFALCLLSCVCVHAQYQKRLYTLIDNIENKCIEWRRQIHEHPELANHEVRTAALVAAHLHSLGFEVKEQVAKTGVIGLLRGKYPGPCLALRADMDGLPVAERNDLPFASKDSTIFNGQPVAVMHACGHDAHVAMLMCVAEVLATTRNELHGTIKFIFQPAEEAPPEGEAGGAPLMLAEGVMENPHVDAIIGLHIQSRIEVGRIEYRTGPFLAAADFFTIRVKGKASHGSQPWLGVDPITTAAQIITGLQTIVSRESELTKAPVVISVGKIQGGVRNNIISEECTMLGTIRTLDSTMQKKVQQQFVRTVSNIAASTGAEASIVLETKALVTYNDPALTKQLLPSLQTAAGAANVAEREWVTGAEDFSYYGTKAPAFYFYLGGLSKGRDPASVGPHHTPDFIIDEAGMKTGIKAFCQIALDYFKLK